MSTALVGPQLGSAVLMAIDVQVGFVKEPSAHVVPVIVDLMRAWQVAGGATAVATFTNPPGSQYETISGWTKLRTPEEQALAPELAPVANAATERITKSTSSFFKVAGVLETFRARGWTEVVLTGIDTDSCVHDSAADAYQYGITPWLVVDACASSGGQQYHEAALLLAARNFGSHLLLTSSDVHRMLSQGGYQ
ncbi:isochorismatase family cysteine hydrolase [Kitasatospora sp. NPDC002965]|uniref:isochorismatase family cysteine hydrolase n=1 Tax=Kitasatospora sp. NPDC002965 TaxID=3154775 RepID=UPI0033A1750F